MGTLVLVCITDVAVPIGTLKSIKDGAGFVPLNIDSPAIQGLWKPAVTTRKQTIHPYRGSIRTN